MVRESVHDAHDNYWGQFGGSAGICGQAAGCSAACCSLPRREDYHSVVQSGPDLAESRATLEIELNWTDRILGTLGRHWHQLAWCRPVWGGFGQIGPASGRFAAFRLSQDTTVFLATWGSGEINFKELLLVHVTPT